MLGSTVLGKSVEEERQSSDFNLMFQHDHSERYTPRQTGEIISEGIGTLVGVASCFPNRWLQRSPARHRWLQVARLERQILCPRFVSRWALMTTINQVQRNIMEYCSIEDIDLRRTIWTLANWRDGAYKHVWVVRDIENSKTEECNIWIMPLGPPESTKVNWIWK